MKRWKGLLITVIVLLVLGGVSVGGIYFYMNYQKSNLRADVFLVSNLNMGYDMGATSSAGYVSNSSSQSIKLNDNKVKEILVSQGDTVSIGDPLFQYDTRSLDLDIEMKQLEIQNAENDIIKAQRDLDILNATVPVVESTEIEEPLTEDDIDFDYPAIETPEQMDGAAYNFVNGNSVPYAGDGTAENPFRFLCTQDSYVLGVYINTLIEFQQTAAFEIWSNNDPVNGTMITLWTINGAEYTEVTPNGRYAVTTHENLREAYDIERMAALESALAEAEAERDSEEVTTGQTYTAKELEEAKADKQQDIKDNDVERRTKELELERLESKRDDYTVKATVNGVVQSVGDPENPSTDGAPFMVVSGEEGLFVVGEISELSLDAIQVGTEITLNSWNTGMTYSAIVQTISEYPSEDGNQYYADGNPNVSYYPFTAVVSNGDDLSAGEYVQISIVKETTEEEVNSIYIEKAYVRKENGQSYVYKVGPDNTLVKQYVETGKTLWGYSVEIKQGLTLEDSIAFPYGVTAQEGIKVNVDEQSNMNLGG
ncbi:MAG: hypothetical protein ACK5ML_10930 [Lachnospiraceae bacterium]